MVSLLGGRHNKCRPRADALAAIKAAEAASGRIVTRVQIGQDGSIIVELASPAANETTPAPEPNPWDEVFER